MVCAGEGLRLLFPLGPRTLEVEVALRASPGPRYAETDRFRIRYHGTAVLCAEGQRVLDRLVDLLRVIGPRLPRDLTALVTDPGDPRAGVRALELAYPFCTVETWADAGGARHELLLRVTEICNQRCPFCSAPPGSGEPTLSELRVCLERAGRLLPGVQLTITGGEPLLRTDLPSLLKMALVGEHFSRVSIQTNAVHPGRALCLPANSRLSFFVSLHGATDATYDRCTGTSGQRVAALSGIRAFLAQGHPVSINCVVSRLNLHELDDLVRLVADMTVPCRVASLHFSILMCPNGRPEAADLLAPYGSVVPRLLRATALATALQIPVMPLVSSSHASVPPCLVPPNQRRLSGRRPIHRPGETGLPGEGAPWVKATVCADCAASAACLGVPRAYYNRFGLGELRPLSRG